MIEALPRINTRSGSVRYRFARLVDCSVSDPDPKRGGPFILLKEIDRSWTLVFVGDAWMSPYELTHIGGSILYGDYSRVPGVTWLQRLREKCPNSIWMNPEPRRIWDAPSARIVRHIFPMFELTLDGLTEAVDVLRGTRPNAPL